MTLATASPPVFGQSGGLVNFANGYYTGDSSGAFGLTIGFTPRYVKVINMTDAITWEYIEGMAATDSLKTAANGTLSVDTTTAILTNAASFTVTEVAYGGNAAGDGTSGTVSIVEENPALTTVQLTLGGTSACNINTKLFVWMAVG